MFYYCFITDGRAVGISAYFLAGNLARNKIAEFYRALMK